MAMTFHSSKACIVAGFLVLAFTSWLHGQDDGPVKQRIDEVLGALPGLLNSDPTGVAAQKHLRENELTNRVILPYFYEADSPLAEPSQERRRRIKHVEDVIHEHESSLLSVLTASSKQNEVPDQMHRLLVFARATPEVKATLLQIATNESPVGSSGEDAYNTLFMLGLDDENVRQGVIEAISHRDELHTRATMAKELLGGAALRWGMKELLPLYQNFLSVAYKAENYPKRGGRAKLQSQYLLSVRGLAAFGKDAAGIAELIKARVAEMDPVEDADLIATSNETLLILEGKLRPKPLLNLKGELLGISKSAYPASSPTYGTGKGAMPLSSGTASQPILPAAPEARTTSAATTPGEEPASSTPLSIMVVLIAAALCLLWLVLKRRS
jgi:hypothetical protein